jgi:hypothetical protein
MQRREFVVAFLRGTGLFAGVSLLAAGCGESDVKPSPEMQKQTADAERLSEEAAKADAAKAKKGGARP